MANGKKKIIGVLGGISSGKSTVAEILAEKGCTVIDADKLAHKLLENKEIKRKIGEVFGESVFTEAGDINRKNLAELAFESRENTERLNDIVHPGVMAEVQRRIGELENDDSVIGIVLDIPLLVEVGWAGRCDILIFIECEPAKRLERALKKGHFFGNQLEKREKLQTSLDKKAKMSHYTVESNSGLTSLRTQVEKIFSAIYG